MSSDSIFNLVQTLWYLWSLKRNGTDWTDIDTYINDEFFVLYVKWVFSIFPGFEWFHHEKNSGNPTFDPANYTEHVYILFYMG